MGDYALPPPRGMAFIALFRLAPELEHEVAPPEAGGKDTVCAKSSRVEQTARAAQKRKRQTRRVVALPLAESPIWRWGPLWPPPDHISAEHVGVIISLPVFVHLTATLPLEGPVVNRMRPRHISNNNADQRWSRRS